MHFIALGLLCLFVIALAMPAAPAAEVVTLSPVNYAAYAPGGMEGDAFVGDYVLRNDRITVVVADPELITGRSASRWGRPNVAGCIIDLARRDGKGDYLTGYYPGPLRFKPDAPQRQSDFVDEAKAHTLPGRQPVSGKRVTLELPAYEAVSGRMLKELAALPASLQGPPQPAVEVRYTLEEGWDFVQVELTCTNPTSKPFSPNLNAMLQADHGKESGLALDGRLYWHYDRWWGQAYGILAEDHRMSMAGRSGARVTLGYVADSGQQVVIPAGGTFRVTRKVFPGENLFDVMAIAGRELGMAQRRMHIAVTAPDGPVADALVTALAGETPYAMGKTDAAGTLAFDIPEGKYALRIEPFGRDAQTLNMDTEARDTYQVTCGPAGYVAADIRNEQGKSIPCKVQFRGVDGTPDPYFFPENGEHLVRNLVYSHTGAFRQILPPGKYEAVVTYGPEYDAARQTIEVAPGRETSLKATLAHVVKTTGWISADLQSHSTVSGEASMNYAAEGYVLDPVVDGNSTSSQLGRVLNLLCEGIQFAPPTEHNMISSYAPQLEKLGATHLLATATGIGLTASRRHAMVHLNTFPMPWRPGAHDGGMLQRPEHINQLAWLLGWDTGGDKLIVVNEPESFPLQPRKRMDAYDVQWLEPIIERKAIPGQDNRVLKWLDFLTEGYRLPAVANSGAFHNFHGSGGLRNYMQSPTDDPAKIKPLDVVHAVRKGHVTMTTGPFLEVALHAGSNGGKLLGIPGDDVIARGGKVSLHVRVQCPNWINVDRIQVLANGTPAVNLTRATHPESFSDGVVKFDQRIPLTLTQDAFLIVVASGSGPNLRAMANPTDTTITHVAMANPIYVDIDGKGFEPLSPLDYMVQSRLFFVEPILAVPGAKPGRIDLVLKNTGSKVAKDTVELRADPPEAARVHGDARRSYEIQPGKEVTFTFHVAMNDEYLQNEFAVVSRRYTNPRGHDIGFLVSRSSAGIGRTPAFLGLSVEHSIGAMPSIASVAQVKDALANQIVYPVRIRKPKAEVLANMRFALAGDHLAVYGQVTEPHLSRGAIVWQGSCVELFGSMPGKSISRIFLAPQVGEQPAIAFRNVQGKIVPAPEIQLASQPCAGGYEIMALVPLSLLEVQVDQMNTTMTYKDGMTLLSSLGLRTEGGKFRLECRVTTGLADGGLRSGTIFRSGAPHVDGSEAGNIRVARKADVALDVLNPLSAVPGSKPACIRLRVTNTSAETISDVATLEVDRPDGVRFVGDSALSFTLRPGETAEKELLLALTGKATPGGVEIILARSPGGAFVRTLLQTLEITDRITPSLKRGLSLAKVQEALAEEQPYQLGIGNNASGEARFGVAGSNLALDMLVNDTKVEQATVPWQGSCIEVFGALAGKERIAQVLLAPRVGEKAAAAFLMESGEAIPAPQVQVQSVMTATGYRLQALIPLKLLVGRSNAARFLLEIMADTTDADGKDIHPTVFGSTRAYQETRKFGRIRKM